MRGLLVAVALVLPIAPCVAEDDPDAAPPPRTAPGTRGSVSPAAQPAALLVLPATPPALPFSPPQLATRPRGMPPAMPAGVATRVPTESAAAGAAAGDAAPLAYTAEDKWSLAGYNNDEVIYTIVVTNHESRVLRCTALLEGTFIENGEKVIVSDRQTITVLPGERTPLGNWQGMDRQSGVRYSVKCRPA